MPLVLVQVVQLSAEVGAGAEARKELLVAMVGVHWPSDVLKEKY